MKNYTLVIIITLLLAILVIAVGFATIATVNLKITGNAAASASQSNFNVKLTGTPTTGGSGTTTAEIANDGKSATMNVSGLTTKDQTATATFTISNESTDLKASVDATISSLTNSEYFEVSKSIASSTIAASGTTTITVTVKLLKTPATDQTSGEFTVTISADPAN